NSKRSVTLTIKGWVGQQPPIHTLTVPYRAFSRTLQWIQRQGGQILHVNLQSSPFHAHPVEKDPNKTPTVSESPSHCSHLRPTSEDSTPSPACVSHLLSLNLDTEKFITLSSRRNRRKIRMNRQKRSPVHPQPYRPRKGRR
ncbi:MAG: hypothetical protein AB4058_21195, partial [Microcystaceae cyanobacterium]